ncbi:cytochrome P450 [Amycolatopsis dendrobii]|uniref:Cytochrome P450 n=1 Tax=Amycolatopsis dendrobii TaxID=2760662 RepID=A0A7W3Z8J0_9PSEU|nr:cytochrome P450 [Amycolatopsis dendrobii]MBB1151724.1 cytochrome P450 [Amycolatopsis dendrobii]
MPGPPPGPAGDRIAGNLAAFTADPLGFLARCSREHGDVVSIGSRNVLLTAPDDVERVLVDRAGEFAKSSPRTRRRARKQGFPRATMNSDGAVWRSKRARLGPVFARGLVVLAAETAGAEARRIAWPEGAEFDPAPAAARLALRSITFLLFGAAASDRDADAVGRLVHEIMDLSVSPYVLPSWVPTPGALRMRRALRDVSEVVAKARRGDAPVLSALAGADDDEMRDELATLVLSGYETTKNAILWTLHLLAAHPEAADRAAAADSFADAVVREAMRLYPPAWLTSRETLRDVELGGFAVPADTTVSVSQWVTHRDPRWYPEPHEFRPERWLTGADRPRGAYFPFGLGPRACIGAALATAEAVAAVTCLCARFRLLPGDAVVRPRPALSLQPEGLRLRVAVR